MTNTQHYHLSTRAIAREMTALSALNCILHKDTSRPAMLTPGHERALSVVIKNAFSFVCLSLMPVATDCNLNDKTASAAQDTDNDENLDIILSIDLSTPQGTSTTVIGTLRHLIEQAIMLHALHLCYMSSDHNLAQSYLTQSRAITLKILSMLDPHNCSDARLTPTMY